MPDITDSGQAIEGLAVSGQSRRPLDARGLIMYNRKRCYLFVASFDVRVNVDKPVPKESRWFPETSTSINTSDRIICEKANIYSTKQRFNTEVAKGSSTHNSNLWKFPQHTAVLVDKVHNEIANAKAAREKASILKTTKTVVLPAHKE